MAARAVGAGYAIHPAADTATAICMAEYRVTSLFMYYYTEYLLLL